MLIRFWEILIILNLWLYHQLGVRGSSKDVSFCLLKDLFIILQVLKLAIVIELIHDFTNFQVNLMFHHGIFLYRA